MSTADLRRLIQQATPRVEDVRSPDRTDFIRREHGHLSLQEVVNALDALEFSVDSFLDCMRDVIGDEGSTAVETAVHGLFRVLDGMRVLCPPVPEPEPNLPAPAQDEQPAEEAVGWQEAAAAAKARGAELFKLKDFVAAAAAYTDAIRMTPVKHIHTLYSNRSAALLQAGDAAAALADARRAVELAPDWPKGHFREGCCLRQLGRLRQATAAFGRGHALEPGNPDWGREVEKTERLHRAQPAALVRQALLQLLPGLLAAWVRGGDAEGVLQVQVNGELEELGTPKWQLLRDRRAAAKASLRYAFCDRKAYLGNLAANLQQPPADGVAVADLAGKQLQIPEVVSFLAASKDLEAAAVHLDIRQSAGAGRVAAVVCLLPCAPARAFVAALKDPGPPKGPVEGVLQIQRQSGFPKALPRLLGFQTFPGDLNFPVIDLQRDAPDAAGSG